MSWLVQAAVRAGGRCGLFAGVWVALLGCAPTQEGSKTRSPSSAPPAWFGQKNQSLRIPGGEKCLGWLPKRGVRYQRLEERPGVDTPVEVEGQVAGVSYVSGGAKTIVADCRLVLALDWIGPVLRQFDVHEVHHSGAYVYRTTRSGRPSLHARGLAIDLHAFVAGQREVEVERDYRRGVGDGCDEDSPLLNRLVCRLRRVGLFQELITPDHDADHHDHIHIAISPRPSTSGG